LREAVAGLHDLASAVDERCAAAELDKDLNADGIKRRCEEVGRTAFKELKDFKPLKAAQRWVGDDLARLEKQMTKLLPPPATTAECVMAQEIRTHIARPERFALSHIADPLVLQAVLYAPPFLIGLSETELGVVRDKARRALHPAESAAIRDIRGALVDVEEVRVS
jgi:hypothetical protein